MSGRVLTLTLLMLLLSCAAARAGAIGLGVNYDWWKLTLESPSECKAAKEPRTAGSWILPHYDDASVRSRVKGQLRAMRASGFTTLRILVFHYHSTDAVSDDSFDSTDGSVAPADKARLRNFVTDIAAAGFKTLEVAPTFQAENELFCKDREWGDCFDAKRTDENWRFISQVVSVVRPAAGEVNVRFDLGNEQAPDPRMPPRALAHAKTYLQTIAGRFQASYGDGWLISAARSERSPPTETRDRFELLVADLAAANLTPKYLELHNYSPDASDMKASLDEGNTIAQRIGAKLILGELRYHSDVQASAIAGWLADNPSSSLVDLIQWPELDPSHICAIDPPPPYTPGPLGAVLFAQSGASPAPALARATDKVWLAVSDIHLDPFDRSPQPSLVGSDTNLALFDAAIARMKRAVPDPAVVLLPGDFFVHDFPSVAARKTGSQSDESAGVRTMQGIASAFDRAFPHAQFAIAFGNNDSACGDYKSDGGSAYFAAVARIWEPLVNRRGAAPDFATSFARNGYYTARLPVRGLRLVVLDTVVLSNAYGGSCPGSAESSANELQWLRTTLRATPAGTRNLVMMHVPPGYDAFTTEALLGSAPGGVRIYPNLFNDIRAKFNKVASAAAPWPFLNPSDNGALIAALTAPDSRVAYAVAGHAHRFDFRIAGGVPIVVLGSLSPVYHNNPAFYALHVSANGSLRDIDVYAFDEPTQTWLQPWSFGRTWSIANLDAASLLSLHARLGADPELRRRWELASNGWPSDSSVAWRAWGALWRVPWCAQTTLEDGFAQCAGIERRLVFVRVLLAAALLVLIAGAVTIVLLVLRKRRRRRFRSAG